MRFGSALLSRDIVAIDDDVLRMRRSWTAICDWCFGPRTGSREPRFMRRLRSRGYEACTDIVEVMT